MARTCATWEKRGGRTVLLVNEKLELPRQGIGVRLREHDEVFPGPFRQPSGVSETGTGREEPKVMNTDQEKALEDAEGVLEDVGLADRLRSVWLEQSLDHTLPPSALASRGPRL